MSGTDNLESRKKPAAFDTHLALSSFRIHLPGTVSYKKWSILITFTEEISLEN